MTPEFFLELLRDPRIVMGVSTVISVKQSDKCAKCEPADLRTDIDLTFRLAA